MAKECVLVTGPSSGIGQELARLFAADGSDLVLVSRNEARLRELAGELERDHRVVARVIAEDLTDPAAPGRLVSRLEKEKVAVDVLVNNAGCGLIGHHVDLPMDRQLQMIQLNVTSLVELTRRLLPPMVARGRGGVLNVASTAAFQPGPTMAVYYATKAFVLFYSEALAEELKGSGVTVNCLCPGPTYTGFLEAAGASEPLLFKLGAMDAATVARQGHAGFRRRHVTVVAGWMNWLGVQAVRVAPRSLVRKIVRRLQS
jgi:short-subunit dehydrogenase